MKENSIDYSKLNDRIVEQAFESAYPTELSRIEFQKLIQGKIDRAEQAIEYRKQLPSYSWTKVWRTGNEVLGAHSKHALNGRDWGWNYGGNVEV